MSPYETDIDPKGATGLSGRNRAVRGGRAKRMIDVILALLLIPVALVVLLPFFFAIKLSSKGPIVFRQTRYGLGMETFEILKLRTLTVQENNASFRQVQGGDARITKVGGFLRRTSFDELPQLLNVLRGDMSLVGPRPHPTKLDAQFAPLISNYENRYSVRPGITGLAQVRGHRGPTPSVEIMTKRIESDLEYASDFSIRMDLNILLKTVAVVFGSKNAI